MKSLFTTLSLALVFALSATAQCKKTPPECEFLPEFEYTTNNHIVYFARIINLDTKTALQKIRPQKLDTLDASFFLDQEVSTDKRLKYYFKTPAFTGGFWKATISIATTEKGEIMYIVVSSIKKAGKREKDESEISLEDMRANVFDIKKRKVLVSQCESLKEVDIIMNDLVYRLEKVVLRTKPKASN